MNKIVPALLVSLLFHVGCGKALKGADKLPPATNSAQSVTPTSYVSGDAAIKIAEEDAKKHGLILEGHPSTSCEQALFWRVFIEPPTGGGKIREYIVVKRGGLIINRREFLVNENAGLNEGRASSAAGGINKQEAIDIANRDANVEGARVNEHNLTVCELKTVWRVVFSPKVGLNGGGPEYVIGKQTGEILDKQYSQ